MSAAIPFALPPRAQHSHKGNYGAVCVLGGAPGMVGAALLAGRAALCCGAGRVYVGLLDTRLACDLHTPELMLCDAEHPPALAAPACVVAGPGLGMRDNARRCLRAALALPHALLLDADALNLLACDAELRRLTRARDAPTVITPHPGEAGRLLGSDSAVAQAERGTAIRALSELTGAIVVLKGAGTLILAPGGAILRNATGNPGMAAPGMGDVLSGMIAALLAQGMPPAQAAIAGVWLHGAAGDAAVASGHGPAGLMASEILPEARRLLNARAT